MREGKAPSLPKGWEIKELGELGRVSMCKRILKKQTLPKGDIPFYKIGTFGKIPNAFISKEVYEEYLSKYSFPKKGDILISASGTIGRRVIYDGKPAYFQDSNIVWIDNNERKVLNEYLYKFYGFCNWNPSKGATISRLYNDDLRKIKIPIPPLPEQKRIVSILDRAFDAIDKAKANAEQNLINSKELFESYLQSVFENKGDDWEEKPFGKVCEIVGGSQPPKPTFVYEPKDDYIRLIQVRDYRTSKYITYIPKNKAKKFCSITDIMIGRYGPPIFGIFRGLEGAYNVALMKALPSEELFDKEFFYWFLKTNNLKKFVEKSSKRAAGQDGVRKEVLYTYPTPIPPLSEQLHIVHNLVALSDKTKKLEAIYKQKINDLEELKKSILQKAFNGELTKDVI